MAKACLLMKIKLCSWEKYHNYMYNNRMRNIHARKFSCFSTPNDFRIHYIHSILNFHSKVKTKWPAVTSIEIYRKTQLLKTKALGCHTLYIGYICHGMCLEATVSHSMKRGWEHQLQHLHSEPAYLLSIPGTCANIPAKKIMTSSGHHVVM